MLFDADVLESLGHYGPAGFHPVSIRDSLFNGKYHVLHR